MINYRFAVCVWLTLFTRASSAEQVHFADSFDGKLSDKWQLKRLPKDYFRIRKHGLELRVVPGKLATYTPMLILNLPLPANKPLVASVKVSILDKLTREGEFAGLCLVDETGPEFSAKIALVEGRLVYAPGRYEFTGKPGGEGDPKNFRVHYTEVVQKAGPLRLILDRDRAFFQVGPDEQGKFLNFFHSAVRPEVKQRRFALVATGAPSHAEHWVRFEEFKLVTP